MKTAILIPCYNEAKTIQKVVEDFKQEMPHATIYVYDNNSTDDTYAIASSIEGVVVRKEPKQGKGNVVRSMFRDIDADCYIMADGDDTYPASFGTKLEALVLKEGVDMAIGDRLSSTYFTENKRRFHNGGNVIVRKMINFLFGSDLNDIMTGARAFSRDFVKSFPVISKGFEIETEMTIFSLDHNFKLAEVPIEYRDRPEGSESKLNTYSDGAKVLFTIARLFRDTKPIAFFSLIALLFMLLAVSFFIPVFIDYLSTGLVLKFPTLIVSCVLGVIAFLTFFSGVILSVLRNEHKQTFERDLTILRYLINQNKD